MMKKVFAIVTLVFCVIGMSMLNKTHTHGGGHGGGEFSRGGHGYYGHRALYYGNDPDWFAAPIIVDATASSESDDDDGYDDTDYNDDEPDYSGQ
jgi:hypothetical protein